MQNLFQITLKQIWPLKYFMKTIWYRDVNLVGTSNDENLRKQVKNVVLFFLPYKNVVFK